MLSSKLTQTSPKNHVRSLQRFFFFFWAFFMAFNGRGKDSGKSGKLNESGGRHLGNRPQAVLESHGAQLRPLKERKKKLRRKKNDVKKMKCLTFSGDFSSPQLVLNYCFDFILNKQKATKQQRVSNKNSVLIPGLQIWPGPRFAECHVMNRF